MQNQFVAYLTKPHRGLCFNFTSGRLFIFVSVFAYQLVILYLSYCFVLSTRTFVAIPECRSLYTETAPICSGVIPTGLDELHVLAFSCCLCNPVFVFINHSWCLVLTVCSIYLSACVLVISLLLLVSLLLISLVRAAACMSSWDRKGQTKTHKQDKERHWHIQGDSVNWGRDRHKGQTEQQKNQALCKDTLSLMAL